MASVLTRTSHKDSKEKILRKRVREIIDHFISQSSSGKRNKEPDMRSLYSLLGQENLLAPGWPQEYGGQGLSYVANTIVLEEIVRSGLSETLYLLSVHFVGGLLLLEGTQTQKQVFLPKIAAGGIFFSILYSEEQAGSDLGSIQTVGHKNGNYYIIAGTKKYSLKSMQADYAICAVRTRLQGPTFSAISLFIIPLDDPAVHVKELASISDEQFCLVELNNVIVPQTSLFGKLNQGWAVINQGIALERIGFDYLTKAYRHFDLLVQAKSYIPPFNQVEKLISTFQDELHTAQIYTQKVVQSYTELGQVSELEGAIAKLVCSELAAKIIQTTYQVISFEKAFVSSEGRELYYAIEAAYRESPGLLLSAGSSEIMLETIARRCLS